MPGLLYTDSRRQLERFLDFSGWLNCWPLLFLNCIGEVRVVSSTNEGFMESNANTFSVVVFDCRQGTISIFDYHIDFSIIVLVGSLTNVETSAQGQVFRILNSYSAARLPI